MGGLGAVWVTEPEVAVMAIEYVPGGVPGLPLPPPPPPCRPPPQESKRHTSINAHAELIQRVIDCRTGAIHSRPARGSVKINAETATAPLGTAAVVEIVSVTRESPLPEPT